MNTADLKLHLFRQIDNLPDEVLLQLQNLLNSWQQQPNTQLTPPPVRKAGSLKGAFIVPDDFNEPLDDFKDYMP